MNAKSSQRLELGSARDIAEGCVANRLRRADRAVMTFYDAALRPFGLKMTQFSLLVALRPREPVTIQDLARAMVMDRTTLTRNLAALERRGLVQVEPGEDRRTREARLSEAGHGLLARAYPGWRKAQGRVRDRLGAGRTRRLVAELSDAVKALT